MEYYVGLDVSLKCSSSSPVTLAVSQANFSLPSLHPRRSDVDRVRVLPATAKT